MRSTSFECVGGYTRQVAAWLPFQLVHIDSLFIDRTHLILQMGYTAVSVTVALILQYLLDQFPALCHLNASQGRCVVAATPNRVCRASLPFDSLRR
jgi:hypothetical protein